ncbi:MAG: carboxylating nicotinate-nucleotide diphosphorylase [Bryobacterales bacterium]|nr:carboxylating nicotinate-nucleotide diphosphorylase [Bryobacterales bacterium]
MLHWDHPQVRELIRLAVAEDVGAGDVTTEACVPVDSQSVGYFLPKQDLTLAGTELLRIIFQEETVEILEDDGTRLCAGQVFAKVAGATRRLLTMERTALNFLQRACGVATLTSQFLEAIEGTGCTLLDTRKTSPGMRVINKLSVRAGGGTNHRLGLFDAVLIKNNHVDAAGGLTQAVENCRPTGRAIEVEVRDRAELNEALRCGIRHVLLDNFSPQQVAEAVEHVAGRAKLEVSGNVGLATIRGYAEAGVDYISVGALTHSAPAADISFRLE